MFKKIVMVASIVCLMSAQGFAQEPAKKAKSKKAKPAAAAVKAAEKAPEHKAEESHESAPSSYGMSSDKRMYSVGLVPGMQFPSGGIDSRFAIGARFDYEFMPNFAAGLAFQHSSKAYNRAGTIKFLNIHVVPQYVCNGFHGGLKIGMTSVTGAAFGFTATSTNFSFGPSLGYDFTVAPGFAVGPEIDYLIVASSSSFQLFNLGAHLKYSF